MCMYENVTEHYTSCRHDVPGFGPLVYNCPRYLKRLARFREADRKWREGSQERCPPTPFNMFSCSDREAAPKRVSVEVPGLCWQCVDRGKQTDLRVKVRDCAEWGEGSYRGMTPYSDGGYASDTMGPPHSPPASSSDGDEFDDDDRFGPHIVIPDGCWANYSHPDVVESPVLGEPPYGPRRSQRLVEQQTRKVVPSTMTARGRGRTSQRKG